MPIFRHIERPVLLPLSLIYGVIVIIRNWLFDLKIIKSVKFRIPVISVGNLSVGGTGKTPHVEYLTGILHNDYRIAVLSRGYKRKTDHFILARKKSKVRDIGDEPMQIFRKYPDVYVAVDKKRVDGVKTLCKIVRKLDLVILDDAFQHRYIKAGLSIVLIDFNKPVFNDILLPAGNLREPVSSIERADIIVITKCPPNLTSSARGNFISKLHPAPKQDFYFTRYEYGALTEVFNEKENDNRILSYKQLKKPGVSVMMVTGIANPAPLLKYIGEHAKIDEVMAFPDHHYFNEGDIRLIKLKFEGIDAAVKFIIVTEKDAVRLRETIIHDKKFREAFYYVPVEVRFLAKGEKPFIKKIYKYMKKAK